MSCFATNRVAVWASRCAPRSTSFAFVLARLAFSSLRIARAISPSTFLCEAAGKKDTASSISLNVFGRPIRTARDSPATG